MTRFVTRKIALNADRETEKAWCDIFGAYLPKSQVSVDEDTVELLLRDNGKGGVMMMMIAAVTMPEWLANKR